MNLESIAVGHIKLKGEYKVNVAADALLIPLLSCGSGTKPNEG
jgi:hypothetical protein